MASSKTLLDLAGDEMRKVLEFVDFKSILALRKVCHGLRNYIDENKPDLKLVSISIDFEPDVIHFYCVCRSFIREIEYRKTENGCTVEHGEFQKNFENLDYFETFFNDLNGILKIFRGVLLNFGVTIGTGRAPDEFFGKLKNILKSQENSLKIQEIEVQITKQEHLLAILPFLDPKILKNLSISCPFNKKVEKSLEFYEIVKLEQWKNARNLKSSDISINSELKNFLNFENAQISLESVNSDGLMELKKNWLSSSNFHLFHINFKNFKDRGQFLEKIGPTSYENPDGKFKEWYFRKKQVDKFLNINLYELAIHFVEVEKENLPENVIIWE